MKMSASGFTLIKTMVSDFVNKVGHNKCVDHSEKVNPMRYRWDLLYAASRNCDGFQISDLYTDGINDTHLDTVMRNVVKQLNLTIREDK